MQCYQLHHCTSDISLLSETNSESDCFFRTEEAFSSVSFLEQSVTIHHIIKEKSVALMAAHSEPGSAEGLFQ